MTPERTLKISMRSETKTQALRPRTLVAALVGSAAILALSACGNHRPDENKRKNTPPTCINSCEPDLGSRAMTPQDCNEAEAGLEFLPLPIWDFGPLVDKAGAVLSPARSLATGMYYYDDKTSVFRVPGKIWEPATEVAFSGVPPYPVNESVKAGWIPPEKYDELTQYWPVRPPHREAVGRCGEPLPFPNDPDATLKALNAKPREDVHYALHVAGGPFMEWGGGMGRMLKCMNTDSRANTDALNLRDTPTPWLPELDLNKYLCANRDSTTFHKLSAGSLAACPLYAPASATKNSPEAELMRSVCPKRDQVWQTTHKSDATDEPYLTGMSLDLHEWEGIAFWARRSPNSQEGIRIAVADKYTDDDMSYLSMKYDEGTKAASPRPRYCERKIVCSCQNNKPCTKVMVADNVFDAEGNRVRWAAAPGSGQKKRLRLAVDGDPIVDVEHYPNLVQELRKRHSLINMAGETIKNAKFSDGTAVEIYNGPNGDGQPHDSDLYFPREESFCFDPAVDPVPPPGTPYSQIINRAFQNNRIIATEPTDYEQGGPLGFFFNATRIPDRSNRQILDSWTDKNKADDRVYIEQLPVQGDATEVTGYNYTPCGDTFCDAEYSSLQAHDPQAYGRKCTEFPFKGSITYSYCFNKGEDPDPPEGTQQCGDFWLKPVTLTTDWAFYKVPFSSLIQQGWAKRQYKFDLTSITDVRIQWDRGWLDVWLSDVRFYRTKRQ